MNAAARKLSQQKLLVYTGVDGGGFMDVAEITMLPGVSMYHDSAIQDMKIAERICFVPYLLSVLATLGHQGEQNGR